MRNTIKQLFGNKLLRFFLVAGLNTLFGYGLFALLIWAGFYYPIALFIATILGILFNFKTYGTLVFNNNNNKLLFRFVIVYAILYLFNYLGLSIFLYFGINNYIGGAILAVPAGLLGFVLNKTFVFPNKTKQSTQS